MEIRKPRTWFTTRLTRPSSCAAWNMTSRVRKEKSRRRDYRQDSNELAFAPKQSARRRNNHGAGGGDWPCRGVVAGDIGSAVAHCFPCGSHRSAGTASVSGDELLDQPDR